MPIPKPLSESMKKLVEAKVVEAKKGVYIYSPEFEFTAKELRAHPPGLFEGTRLAHEVDKKCAPVLLAYAQYFTSQFEIKKLATAYVILVKHIKRLGLKIDLDIPTIYATYYVNNHELEVEA